MKLKKKTKNIPQNPTKIIIYTLKKMRLIPNQKASANLPYSEPFMALQWPLHQMAHGIPTNKNGIPTSDSANSPPEFEFVIYGLSSTNFEPRPIPTLGFKVVSLRLGNFLSWGGGLLLHPPLAQNLIDGVIPHREPLSCDLFFLRLFIF